MITARAIKNAVTAKGYYTEHLASKSEYYSEASRIDVQWFGVGCRRLGLEAGAGVTQEAFERLCDNLHPFTGAKLTARHRTSHRRVCFDFVVSAPKSVSLMTFLGGDSRLIGLHEAAARTAMIRMEERAGTRVRKGRMDGERRTGEVVAATVTHTTSRALDPQLHTHYVLFNATWDPIENRWKALQTTEMFEQSGLFTEIYRSELASQLKNLGYRLRPTVNGFEIDGVPPELLERFSKRRKAIRDAEAKVSAKLGKPLSNNARSTLAQKTRNWKDTGQSPDEILEYQRSQLTEEELAVLHRLVPGEPSGGSKEATGLAEGVTPYSINVPTVTASAALDHARDHLFERKSVVPVYALLKEAMAYGHGELKVEQIEEELARRWEFLEFEQALTTHEMVRREQSMVKMVNSGIGRHAPLGPGVGPDSSLNPEQQAAFRAVMNSPDAVMGILGVAGARKTGLLAALADGIQQANRKVIALAPTTAACEALRNRGVKWASTLQNFLASPAFQAGATGSVILVDEAGLLSVGDMLSLLTVAQAGNSRVVLCGDTRQHMGIEAGDALRLLESRSAMQSAGLRRNTRQTNLDYRRAIESFAAGNGAEGLRRLEVMGAIHEVDEDRRYCDLAEGYATSLKQGKSALIVSPTWREISRITEAVRSKLKATGGLGPTDTQVDIYKSLNWTRAQKRDLRNYLEGQILRFHRATVGVGRGESLRVRHREGDAIVATKADGTDVTLTGKQAGCFEVLEAGKLAVAAGEILLIKGNLKAHGLINGKCVRVSAVRPDGGLDLSDGRTIPPEFRTFTHGYAITSMAAQGRTVDHVYVAVDSESIQAANLNQFYVSASRGREQIQVFTDDIETLRTSVRCSGTRVAAVEFVDQLRQRTGEGVRSAAAVRA